MSPTLPVVGAGTVAVVGSGVAGLTAAWALRHTSRVTLFEADGRLGGHAHTRDLVDSTGASLSVDSGFIVHDDRTYPTLLHLFEQLGVQTQDSEMSMSVSCAGCGLQYADALGIRGLFPSWRNLVDPHFLRMLLEVPRLHRSARRLLEEGAFGDVTLGEFLDEERFSEFFVQHFAVPLVACVWSSPPGRALEYPARYLFSFLAHHGMLSVRKSPQWRVVRGGSRSYVDLVAAGVPEVCLSTPVVRVEETSGGVLLTDVSGLVREFDAVVVATHPDQALGMLAAPSPLEVEVLSGLTYSTNRVLLHGDASLLPSRRGARASWNYALPACSGGSEVLVTYDMSRLQGLSTTDELLVSLNAEGSVSADLVLEELTYDHPLYSSEFLAMQSRLGELGSSRVRFAGAYHGWGFHEDGALAGLVAARALGGDL